MSNQLYYAISGFFTLLIGLPLAFNPIILVVLYYLITKIVFKLFNKTPTELDNILEKLTLKHIIATISYYMKVVTDFIFNWINIIYINPLKSIVNYQTRWIEWISSGKAGDYIIEFIMDAINFVIFQIQEMINSAFEWANSNTGGIIPKLTIDLVDFPKGAAYLLDNYF
jgi:hypothetical protein